MTVATSNQEQLRRRMSERTYNGWPSYETWLAYSWLSNDPLLDATCALLASDAASSFEAADALADFVEEHLPLDEPGLVADLLRTGLDAIQWERIAQHYREDT
jgi:hypothetical protein